MLTVHFRGSGGWGGHTNTINVWYNRQNTTTLFREAAQIGLLGIADPNTKEFEQKKQTNTQTDFYFQ